MKLKPDNLGFSLIELIVSIVILSVVVLAAADLKQWASTQAYLLAEENTAEQNVLLAAYYMKVFMSQAVGTICNSPAADLPATVTLTPSLTPPFIGQGRVDCRLAHSWPSLAAGPDAFAVFNREIGSPGASGFPVSNFVGTGIYFQPPSGSQSGTLYFAQAKADGVSTTIDLANAIAVDHIVDFQITSAPTVVGTALEEFTVQITARYMLTRSSTPSYLITPPVGATLYKDVSMTVNIGLRDNWLGTSLTGSGSSERLYGGLYFFRTQVPFAATL